VIGEEKIVVAFDGECLMCSRSIRWLAANDPADQFRFVRLQSPRGREMEKQAGTGDLMTALVAADGRIYSRSDAVLRICRALEWRFRGISWIGRTFIPRRFRDAAYDFIAARRHRWFGKGDACAMPSEALRVRLLE
jgi:predicted DCC family thiol-disulfide oxidoreductase YuxK